MVYRYVLKRNKLQRELIACFYQDFKFWRPLSQETRVTSGKNTEKNQLKSVTQYEKNFLKPQKILNRKTQKTVEKEGESYIESSDFYSCR